MTNDMKEQQKLSGRSFLGGAKWADGDVATDAELTTTYELIQRLNPRKRLSAENADLIERCINRHCLDVLRFSKSEWGNDYYACFEAIGDIYQWLDRFNKHHKLGKYFGTTGTKR